MTFVKSYLLFEPHLLADFCRVNWKGSLTETIVTFVMCVFSHCLFSSTGILVYCRLNIIFHHFVTRDLTVFNNSLFA